MTPKDFPQANITMIPPKGQEKTVQPLRVFADGRGFLSMWLPSPEELKAINEGKAICITLYGIHPPVYVGVEDVTTALVARSNMQ